MTARAEIHRADQFARSRRYTRGPLVGDSTRSREPTIRRSEAETGAAGAGPSAARGPRAVHGPSSSACAGVCPSALPDLAAVARSDRRHRPRVGEKSLVTWDPPRLASSGAALAREGGLGRPRRARAGAGDEAARPAIESRDARGPGGPSTAPTSCSRRPGR